MSPPIPLSIISVVDTSERNVSKKPNNLLTLTYRQHIIKSEVGVSETTKGVNDMNQYLNVGSAIKRVRQEKGVTARYLAKILNIAPSTLSKYESNERKIKADKLPIIAEALGVPVDVFFAQKIDETPTSIRNTA
jgi:ribosome-binding protein aMBF1 (putative translation factor)